jgi:hypothetical protein
MTLTIAERRSEARLEDAQECSPALVLWSPADRGIVLTAARVSKERRVVVVVTTRFVLCIMNRP